MIRYARSHAALRVLEPVLDDEDEDGAYPVLPREERDTYEAIFVRELDAAKQGAAGPVCVGDSCIAGRGTLAFARLTAWRQGGSGAGAVTFQGRVVVSPRWAEPDEATKRVQRKHAALRRAMGV
jgi:hypothetical protein